MPTEQAANSESRAVLQELESQLQNIYNGFDVTRERVAKAVDRGRALAGDSDAWPGGAGEARAFLQQIEILEKKIGQTLDLRRLRQEGLVKSYRF